MSWLTSHFWVAFCFCLKASQCARPFVWIWDPPQVDFHANQAHFDKNGFGRILENGLFAPPLVHIWILPVLQSPLQPKLRANARNICGVSISNAWTISCMHTRPTIKISRSCNQYFLSRALCMDNHVSNAINVWWWFVCLLRQNGTTISVLFPRTCTGKHATIPFGEKRWSCGLLLEFWIDQFDSKQF